MVGNSPELPETEHASPANRPWVSAMHDRLRYHVSGAAERGEATPIVAREVVAIRDFACHGDALKAQEADRADGYGVGSWAAYKGVTSYPVTLPRELADVKREGQT